MGAMDLPYHRLHGRQLIIDGYQGLVHINPPPELLRRYREVLDADQALTRDLEALRNPRQEQLTVLPAAYSAVQRSILTYGLPDFTAWSLLSPADRQRLRRALEQAIASSEPRLTRVQVILEPLPGKK